jgi:hypothetical protein
MSAYAQRGGPQLQLLKMDPLLIIGIVVLVGGGLLVYKEKQASKLNLATLNVGATSAGAAAAATLAAANSTQTGATEGISTASTVAADAATGNVAGAATAAISGLLTQLTQHSARLKGAQNENAAADQAIPAFDADLQSIVAAYEAGTITQTQAISALLSVDANIKAYLKSHVGPAGTAWDGSGFCTKTCTVGCCIFYNNLHPAIVGPDPAVQGGRVMDGALGLVPLIASGKAGTVYIPQVFPPSNKAYGNYARAGYTISITPPSHLSLSAVIGSL